MIASLRGTVLNLSKDYLILDVDGVGYKVFTLPGVLEGSPVGTQLHVFTYLAVRETALDLFGFTRPEELTFFELLLTVSGIGPKSALNVLSLAPLEKLLPAIAAHDVGYLSKVSGIGKKSAEKIVFELSDKVQTMTETYIPTEGYTDDSETLAALEALGYSPSEARQALKHVTASSIQDRIKEALKLLSKKA